MLRRDVLKAMLSTIGELRASPRASDVAGLPSFSGPGAGIVVRVAPGTTDKSFRFYVVGRGYRLFRFRRPWLMGVPGWGFGCSLGRFRLLGEHSVPFLMATCGRDEFVRHLAAYGQTPMGRDFKLEITPANAAPWCLCASFYDIEAYRSSAILQIEDWLNLRP